MRNLSLSVTVRVGVCVCVNVSEHMFMCCVSLYDSMIIFVGVCSVHLHNPASLVRQEC